MTVKELIAALQALPPDARVLLENTEFQNYYALGDVRLHAVRHADVGLGPLEAQWITTADATAEERAVLLSEDAPERP